MEQRPDAQLIRLPGVVGLSPIIVAGPDALRDILNTHCYDFEKPWGIRAFLARAIGWGLIMAEGAEHKKQKRALTPAFHIRRIRELYSLMWDKTQIFLEEVEKEIQRNSGGGGSSVVEVSEWARYVPPSYTHGDGAVSLTNSFAAN